MGPKQDIPIIGMLIDESLPVEQVVGSLVEVDIEVSELSTVQRLKRLVNTVTSARDKMVIEEYAHLVVHLPAAGYGTTEFDMTDMRRTSVVGAGQRAMASYLDGLNPGSSKRGMSFGTNR